MSKQEFEHSLGRSPFLWEVLKFGKPIFTTLSGTEWELDFRDYLDLAGEYLSYAKDALNESEVPRSSRRPRGPLARRGVMIRSFLPHPIFIKGIARNNLTDLNLYAILLSVNPRNGGGSDARPKTT